ncbi:hypothetical protein ACFXKI_00740 [Streptomyces mirabilis]|uniref:hypothetical protein n=1 Tax=Streptomyces mirabilis TaxID=68239 RepID=UPI003678E100
MTITDLIPGLKGSGSRRAADKLAELRDENRKLLTRQMAADDYFALLMQDRDEVYTAWTWAEQARQEAETAAACMQSERDEWRDEALALRARFGPQIAAEANATRVDVPPMVRPIDGPEDQATAPIDVRPLWQALGLGTVTVVDNPNAADPARTTH